MVRKLRITVDHDVCVGNDMCTNIATEVFALNESLQSEVANPEGDPEEKVLEAAENCPVSAIAVADEETGETLFP
jgi:ferredoxin